MWGRPAALVCPCLLAAAADGSAQNELVAGNFVLPGGVVVWRDASGRRAFRSPIPFKVPRGRYVWKGQIYWVRSGGRIFAPVEPHIIQARTIRHNKNCDFS